MQLETLNYKAITVCNYFKILKFIRLDPCYLFLFIVITYKITLSNEVQLNKT